MLTGDDEEDNEDPEPGDVRRKLFPLDYTCPKCGKYMSLYAVGDDEAECDGCGYRGPLSEFDDTVAEAEGDDGDGGPEDEEDEETFGIPELEPDEVNAIRDSLTEGEREWCRETGNEAIASIDEALDYMERHLACLDEDCEDGGYRDGVKAALEELRKARRLLARLVEEDPF